jgi:hypothetical protein
MRSGSAKLGVTKATPQKALAKSVETKIRRMTELCTLHGCTSRAPRRIAAFARPMS